jgi:S-adenosylmethionine:tRNA ribosyltransferase-isomerase
VALSRLVTLDTDALDYSLPASAIAQVPVEPRHASRLLVDRGPGARPKHCRVADLPSLLQRGDLIVVNDTRVLPARLHLRKPTGGAVEVLLLEELGEDVWEALVKPSRRVPPGTTLLGPDGFTVTVGEDLGEGRRRVNLPGGGAARLAAVGEVPLPPYIREPLADPERYQTVYADRPGSVAAPTAGLHLSQAVLAACTARGIALTTVELQVGLDTFRPMTVERVEDHPIHEERYDVPAATLEACARARRVVAIGTTAVRALESAATTGRLTGRTDLFIHAPYDWRVVDVLLTNFHVPRSSLLALVDAFVGPRWRDLYEEALAAGYRFLSFGDAMLLERS